MEKRKGEDDDEVSPFAGLNTTLVLREARCFNDRTINPRKCGYVLTQCLYLLSQGEELTSEEATSLFFSVTKLFQSDNIHLRRLVYLVIKVLKIDTDNSLIVVSCLNKDMNNQQDLFRANAIRVLAKIIDASMMGGIERFLKQAIVDKNPFVVISTLVAAQHMFKRTGGDLVKRWVSEIQTALASKSRMAQYHALCMLYNIKSHDKLAISKVVAQLIRKPTAGRMAQCLQIRIIHNLLLESRGQGSSAATLLQFVTDCLHNRNFMVMFEAAKSLCSLPFLSSTQITPAFSVLQDFLTSPIPTQRFAAVRALSKLVVDHPLIVTNCSAVLERLITDPNRNIGTLAITTLLKTGDESNVDRLLKSITGFMSEISDDFKVVLVNAVKTLCLKFPHKHHTLMDFLASCLREEGGFKFKRTLVDAMLTIIDNVPVAKDAGLDHFCEFIEDCEFACLAVKVLHMLGEKGPRTPNPSRYIRFVFNRVILETAEVRAAAVTCLARFGTSCPDLTASVCRLLRRCVEDDCDEVRDRAVMYLALLEGPLKTTAHGLLYLKPPAALADMEVSLQLYLEEGDTDEPFNLAKHLKEAQVEPEAEEEVDTHAEAVAAGVNPYMDLLNSIPEVLAMGTLLKSCEPVEITESETEYVVNCVKHIYPEHVLLQFNVTNNMDDQLLENISVEVALEEDGWTEEFTIPEPSLAHGVAGVTFVGLRRESDKFNSGPIGATLNFEFKQVEDGEVDDEAQQDEYVMEEVTIEESDFMEGYGHTIGMLEFKRLWEAAGTNDEVVKKYSLALDTLQGGVDMVMKMLGVTSCENCHQVPEDARSHGVNLAGTWLASDPKCTVLVRTGFMLVPKKGLTLKIAVRTDDSDLSALLAEAIGS